jgi:2-polyprenyl-3-methyl-5-hydroxy-6-metoxy-1,4-benzoquinol methylase
MNLENEKKRLEEIADDIKYSEDFNGKLMRYRLMELMHYFKGKNVLELGCADGLMTETLVKIFDRVVSVDASYKYCQEVKSRIKSNKLEVICSLFEDLVLDERFDTIIMAHILEHVNDQIQILKLAKNWLNEGGVILIDVPNANSLHRQAGVKMGLLDKCDDLNDLDKKLGHRRVYSKESLRKDVEFVNLKIITEGGVFLKPLTNSQIEKWWSKEMMDAFYELGKEFPDIAGEIYVVCEK